MKNLIRRGNGSYSQQNIFVMANVLRLLLLAMSLFVFHQAFNIFRFKTFFSPQTSPFANIVRMYFVFQSLMKELDVNVLYVNASPTFLLL